MCETSIGVSGMETPNCNEILRVVLSLLHNKFLFSALCVLNSQQSTVNRIQLLAKKQIASKNTLTFRFFQFLVFSDALHSNALGRRFAPASEH